MRTPPLLATTVAVGTLTLAACAQGQGGGAGGAPDEAEYDSSGEVSGPLQVLGFGLNDEVAEVRAARAEDAMPDVDVELVEGGLDPQRFLTAVASGDAPDLIYSTRVSGRKAASTASGSQASTKVVWMPSRGSSSASKA